MAARLNNGFILSITDSMVYPAGDFRDNTAAKESAAIASALSHLIKVANGQIPINMFYSRNQDNNAYAKDENWVNTEYYSGNDMGMAVQKSFWLDLFK